VTEARVRIAIPSRDGMLPIETVYGVLELWNSGRASNIDHVRGGVAPHNRDILTANFLADEQSTHLLCLDSDMEWHARDVEKLLELGVDFAFGKYSGKRQGAPTMCSRLVAADLTPQRGCQYMREEWERCGAGFVLLSRSCVERMFDAYGPSESYVDAEGRALVGLWQTSGRVELDGKMVAETDDYAFCRRWRAIGGRIFTRTDVVLGHIGTHTYRPS
jgi:hypothetical protein